VERKAKADDATNIKLATMVFRGKDISTIFNLPCRGIEAKHKGGNCVGLLFYTALPEGCA